MLLLDLVKAGLLLLDLVKEDVSLPVVVKAGVSLLDLVKAGAFSMYFHFGNVPYIQYILGDEVGEFERCRIKIVSTKLLKVGQNWCI